MNNLLNLSKKTLIVSSWAPPMVGGPQNLYNLFSQFSKDSYSILTSEKNIKSAQMSGVGGNWLPGKYFYYDKEGILAEIKEKPNPVLQQATSKPNKTSFKKIIAAFIGKIPLFGKILYDYLGAIYFIRRLMRQTKKTVIESRAEIIMGISDSGPSMIAPWLAYRAIKIPYVLYLFDIYKGNLLSGPYKLIAKILEKQVLTEAALVLVTNEGTEKFYKKRYGNKIKTAVVYNSVFTEAYEKTRTPYKPQPPHIIIFTGNVYWAQEQSVVNLIKALDFLSDLPLELHLYIPQLIESIKKLAQGKKNIKLLSANQSEMPKIQSSATLLFLPLSWNTKSPDIIATATPGKFTDYLASGRPMLVHAPDYAYVSKYTKENQLGLVVDKNDVQLLADTIRNFFKYPSVGQRYINNALKIFYQNHDARKNAQKLKKLLEMI